MSMQLDHLDDESLQIVFAKLNNFELVQCSRVSRRWQRLATKVFTERIEELGLTYRSEDETIDEFVKALRYFKKLIIGSECNTIRYISRASSTYMVNFNDFFGLMSMSAPEWQQQVFDNVTNIWIHTEDGWSWGYFNDLNGLLDVALPRTTIRSIYLDINWVGNDQYWKDFFLQRTETRELEIYFNRNRIRKSLEQTLLSLNFELDFYIEFISLDFSTL
ncbi:hypothetical protein HA402_012806 [Bradysia odoriphaga]|nr:hypothetical protein HA402_012806 [Bradysia odoriphaga]